jgi:hypothetical protein
LRAVLTNLIDYAGLFPPAGLDMPDAVAKYASYLGGEFGWALGRFVVPVTRLSEFARDQSAIDVLAPWRLSCLIGAEVAADLSEIRRFNGRDGAVIDSIETKEQTGEQVNGLMASLPGSITTYFEVQPNCSVELLSAIHELGAHAKIRTGGVIPDAIPPTVTVAGFLARCASVRTPFKATAGLHHPVRCLKPLTYEANAPTAKMHGFLNVFLAAALAYQGASAEQLTAMLDTEKAESFCFENAIVRCADETLSTDQVRVARQRFAISFGSCSFEEPIEDLQALRLL